MPKGTRYCGDCEAERKTRTDGYVEYCAVCGRQLAKYKEKRN